MPPPKRTIHHILLIDDDEDDYLLLSEAISAVCPDLKLWYSPDCDKDFSKFPWVQPDMIFLDLNMPRRNGFECLRLLKGSSLRDVPVIMYSTTRSLRDVTKAFESGATLFLTKPFSFKDLVASLKDIFSFDWREPAHIVQKWYDGEHHAYNR